MLTEARVDGSSVPEEKEVIESISASGSNIMSKSLVGIGIVDADKSLLKCHIRTLVAAE